MTPDVRLVVLGAGGHAHEIYSYLKDLGAAGRGPALEGVIDEHKPAGPWLGTRVLGGFDALAPLAASGRVTHYLTAVGDNAARRRLAEAADRCGLRPWSLVHPLSATGDDVAVGEGACLAPGSVITTRARLGRHCILNVHASVSHDCRVGDFCNINPGAVIAGNVTVGDGCFLGAGATVIERVTIGAGSVIGAGAVVIRDVPAGSTVVGVPARPIRGLGDVERAD